MLHQGSYDSKVTKTISTSHFGSQISWVFFVLRFFRILLILMWCFPQCCERFFNLTYGTSVKTFSARLIHMCAWFLMTLCNPAVVRDVYFGGWNIWDISSVSWHCMCMVGVFTLRDEKQGCMCTLMSDVVLIWRHWQCHCHWAVWVLVHVFTLQEGEYGTTSLCGDVCWCFIMICYELFFKVTKCFSCGCWILPMYFERIFYFHWIKCSVMQIIDVWSQDAWFYYDLHLVVDIMTCDEWYYFDDNVLIFFDACICKVT